MVYFVVGVLGFVCFGWCGFVWIVFCWFVGGGGVPKFIQDSSLCL